MNSRLTVIAIGLAGIVAIIFILRQTAFSLPNMGGDEIASSVYLGIWATLIGSALLAYRQPIGHTLKQLVIWIGIFLVVMASYTHRYELQDIASKFTGGLIAGSPISSTNLDGRNQITLIRGNSGHFRARGEVGNISVNFLVDTGATEIVLSHDDALRARIDTSSLNYNHPVSTANGITTSARQKIDNISVGSISFQNISVMIARKGDLDTSLLGMNFINRLRAFEIRGDRMIFTQ